VSLLVNGPLLFSFPLAALFEIFTQEHSKSTRGPRR
jgi:hypothetical protein